MWLISLRDLQWRRRRFSIAILGTALVFAMTLLLSGLSASFASETHRTIDAARADAWVVPAGVTGPFTSFIAFPADVARAVATIPGVRRADPVVGMHQAVRLPALRDVNVFGVVWGGVGAPLLADGSQPRARNQIVVDRSLGIDVGDRFTMAGHRFVVSGRTEGLTYLAGIPNLYMRLKDAQALAFSGRDVATSIVTRGVPSVKRARGFVALTNEQARQDMFRPIKNAQGAVGMTQMLLWIVAIMIIGSVVYLSALERVRDFAVLKATGSSSGSLLVGLATQAGIIALAAAILAIGLGRILAPLFPLPVEISLRAALLLPALAIVVGMIASLSGLRRAVSVDPALAFGGP